MRFLIIRHATAEPLREGLSDEDRELTSRGEKRARRAFRGLARLEELDQVLTSPLVRARATADILCDVFDLSSPEVAPELAPGGDHAALFTRLATFAPDASIALVGHEPSLGEIVARLCGGRGLNVDVKRASVAIVEGEPGDGGAKLVAVLPPRILRRVR